jgi:hypothetical protein
MEIKVKLTIPCTAGRTLYFRALEGSGHQQMPIFIRIVGGQQKTLQIPCCAKPSRAPFGGTVPNREHGSKLVPPLI